jgi:hypothetical protein
MATTTSARVTLIGLLWLGCAPSEFDAGLQRLADADGGTDAADSRSDGGGTGGAVGVTGAGGASAGNNGLGGSPISPTGARDRRDLLARSQAAWATLKGRNGPDYSYVNRETIYPFGGTLTTTIEVRGDRVVRRSFDGSRPWTETGATLGTHREDRAAPAITIDELYARCETEVLNSDETQYELYLSTHEDGVIASCKRSPRGCNDDCDRGFAVSSYQFLD